jgi:hypothetical protein
MKMLCKTLNRKRWKRWGTIKGRVTVRGLPTRRRGTIEERGTVVKKEGIYYTG